MLNKKMIVALVACLLGASLLAGCGSSFGAKDLVQGNMDVIYKDKADSTYLEAVRSTTQQAHQDYLDGLDVEADYFAKRYEINFDVAGQAAREEAINLLDKIYSNSKYEVGAATKNGNAEVVSVTIYPINIYYDFDPEVDAIVLDWNSKVDSGAFASEAEAEAAWAHSIVEGLAKHLGSVTYKDPQTIQVQVVQDSSDGKWVISPNDWNRIDELILAY